MPLHYSHTEPNPPVSVAIFVFYSPDAVLTCLMIKSYFMSVPLLLSPNLFEYALTSPYLHYTQSCSSSMLWKNMFWQFFINSLSPSRPLEFFIFHEFPLRAFCLYTLLTDSHRRGHPEVDRDNLTAAERSFQAVSSNKTLHDSYRFNRHMNNSSTCSFASFCLSA